MAEVKSSLHNLELVLKCYIERYAKNGDFTLILKTRYCKSYYGKYRGHIKEITLYVCRDVEGNFYPLHQLLHTLFHEISHHDEYQEKGFKRLRGVMHSKRFYEIYNQYLSILDRKENFE